MNRTEENEAINTLQLNRPFAYSELRNAIDVAIKALEEIQAYRAIGTVEEIQQKDEIIATQKDIIEGLYKDYEKYLKIGTVEECRVAVERIKNIQNVIDSIRETSYQMGFDESQTEILVDIIKEFTTIVDMNKKNAPSQNIDTCKKCEEYPEYEALLE